MERNMEIPMNRLLGVKFMVKIPGRDTWVTIKVLECDVPLPISSEGGDPVITAFIETECGQIQTENKKIPQPILQQGKFKDWVAEDILYEALGRDKPKEELNPDLVGPSEVKRKMEVCAD